MNRESWKVLLVGLGNPGKKYANTPHNIGSLFLDFLIQAWGISSVKKKFSSLYYEHAIEDLNIYLLKPQTFMNLSGSAVGPALSRNGVPIENLFIFHDEVDFLSGKWAVKYGGGHRGHNGLRHIIAYTNSNNFKRFRIGVGRPDDPDLAAYLLSPMPPETQSAIEKIFPEILSQLEAEFMKICK